MRSRIIVHQFHLGFGNIPRKNTADPYPPSMDMQHHLSRFFLAHGEKSLQDLDNEFHRSEIIVQQHHLEKRWSVQSRLALLNGYFVIP